VNACGVTVAMPQGHSWAPAPSNGWIVNMGTPRWPQPSVRPGRQAGRLVVGRAQKRCGDLSISEISFVVPQ
jgi:hypothetical protein